MSAIHHCPVSILGSVTADRTVPTRVIPCLPMLVCFVTSRAMRSAVPFHFMAHCSASCDCRLFCAEFVFYPFDVMPCRVMPGRAASCRTESSGTNGPTRRGVSVTCPPASDLKVTAQLFLTQPIPILTKYILTAVAGVTNRDMMALEAGWCRSRHQLGLCRVGMCLLACDGFVPGRFLSGLCQ